MINKSSIIFLILLFCRALTCQGQVIIPSPQQITLTKGCFSIKDKVCRRFNSDLPIPAY